MNMEILFLFLVSFFHIIVYFNFMQILPNIKG